MLQRIQTIFLFGALASGLSLLIDFMDLASVEGDLTLLKSQSQSMFEDGIFDTSDNMILLILVGLISLVCMIGIFQFKNRPWQLRLARFALFGFLLLIILGGFLFYQEYTHLNQGVYQFEVGYGVIAPVLGILFIILAMRAIRKDEKLIRSMDRLR
ncbi:MAG: DUF4293 domain-containing protein [Saprospiraceae bacterium]|nr:DUF4293 domain-containing protein [Saprospiraceae bacterium]